MTIEIDFSFEIDGLVESINYYRSETSMDPEAMPTPTATGITGTEYTDTTAVQGQGYYVRFGSVRGSEEKISDEIFVYASNGDLYFTFVDLLIVDSSNFAPEDSSSNARAFTTPRNSTRLNEQFFINGLEDRNVIKHISQPTATTTNYSLQKRLLASTLNLSNFTLELVINVLEYPRTTSSIFLIGSGWGSGNGLLLALNELGVINMFPMTSGTFTNPSAEGPVITKNAFHHICVQRISGVFYLYVNGVLVQTQSSNTTLSLSNANCYVVSSDTYRSLNAGFTNVRITLGQRYAQSGFTSSTDVMTTSDSMYNSTVLLLSSNGTSVVESAYQPSSAVTTTSVLHVKPSLVNGNGRFVCPSTNNSAPNVNISALGLSDFTIEFYLKFRTVSSSVSSRFFQIGANGVNSGLIAMVYGTSGQIIIASTNSSASFFNLAAVSDTDVLDFHHYCLQRKGGIFYLFKDGVLISTISGYTSLSITQNTLYLLGSSAATEALDGVLNGFRLTKNVVRYPLAGFTPPSLKFPTAA